MLITILLITLLQLLNLTVTLTASESFSQTNPKNLNKIKLLFNLKLILSNLKNSAVYCFISISNHCLHLFYLNLVTS